MYIWTPGVLYCLQMKSVVEMYRILKTQYYINELSDIFAMNLLKPWMPERATIRLDWHEIGQI